MTTGLLDAASLGNCLIRIISKGESNPDCLLQQYADVRRKAFIDYTNPTSIANKHRLMSDEPEEVKRRDQFFAKVNGDPEFLREMAHQMNEVLEDNFEN